MDQQKKIIFKLSEFPHLSETFILAQMITAIKLGYDVKVIIGRLLNIDNSLYKEVLVQNRIIENIIIENYSIPKNKFLRTLKFILLLIKNFIKINAILSYYKKQDQFSFTWLFQWNFYESFNDSSHVFHVQYGTNRYPLDLLKSTGFYKPALIVTFHGHDAFFPINGFIPNNGYYNNLFTYGDIITANTTYLADKILALGCPEEKLKIIPVGVDTDFFYPITTGKIFDKTLKMITVGRLDPVKGHKYSVEIVNKLVQCGFDVTLTIVGEGAERQTLEELIEINNLTKKVFLLGKKSQNEIRDLLRESDLYIINAVPLIDGRRETQGLATLEAQACGLPVLAFDSGGVKYTIEEGKTGFVFKEYDTESIVNLIKNFSIDRDLLVYLSSNTGKFIDENFSQNHVNNLWGHQYNKLFNK